MNGQTKDLNRSPSLQEIQQNLRDQRNNPVLAGSPVIKEMRARQENKDA